MLTDTEIDLTPSQGRKLEGLRRKVERDHPGGEIKEFTIYQLEESDWPTQKRTLVVRYVIGSPLEKEIKFFEVLRLPLVYTITAKGKVELATAKGLYGNAELQEDDS